MGRKRFNFLASCSFNLVVRSETVDFISSCQINKVIYINKPCVTSMNLAWAVGYNSRIELVILLELDELNTALLFL